MIFRSRALLNACRQIPCQACGKDDGTVVAAHSNMGKGMGIKSPDSWVASLCYACHSEVDQGHRLSREIRRQIWEEAHVRTLRQLIEREILKVAK